MPEAKTSLGENMRRREDSINMDIKVTKYEVMTFRCRPNTEVNGVPFAQGNPYFGCI